MKNPRSVAFRALNEIIIEKGYSNIVLNKILKDINIKEEDKGLITEIVYGTLRYKYSIDVILDSFLSSGIKKTNDKLLNILRMSIYQIRYLDKLPDYAVLNEAVEIAKKGVSLKSSKTVNGVLRNYIRKGFQFSAGKVIDELCFQYSFDKWMVKFLIGQYGEKRCEDILKGLNMRPDVTVRVNAMKADKSELMEKMKTMGYDVRDGYLAKDAVSIIKGASIEKNPLFASGEISVQDESAMLSVEIMNIKAGMSIIDMCSAPGGKACYMAERLNNTGRVSAFDIFEKKIELIKDHAERLQLSNLEAEIGDGSEEKKDLVDSADVVLADVPCSGLGIIRKKPEIKWSKSKKDLNEIVEIQRKILSNSAKYVKINGELIYSTCTLNRNENEENVRWFVSNNDNFVVEEIAISEEENIIKSKEGAVTIIPNEHMDGFFIAKLRRIR